VRLHDPPGLPFFRGEEKIVSYERERRQMVEDQLMQRGISDERVLDAMKKVPRHRFVPSSLEPYAYDDGPLSIGEGQTISQPYMVALMTQELRLKENEIVLEIGTGSGYQTAILAELSQTVFTVERIAVLSERAEVVLRTLGYNNVQLRVGDGTLGWPEKAPFDKILVTAAAPDIVQPLVEQLKIGGTLLVPTGSRYSQMLSLVTREENRIDTKTTTQCVFVPLIGEYGWQED